jgi:hypothetical protein
MQRRSILKAGGDTAVAAGLGGECREQGLERFKAVVILG